MMRLLSVLLVLVAASLQLSIAFTTAPIARPLVQLSIPSRASSMPSLPSSSKARRRQLPLFLADAATPDSSEPVDDNDSATSDIEELEELSTRLGRVKGMLGLGKKNKEDDGLTFRQKLGKAGLSVVLSYGAVSNMSYGISMSIAWYGFSRKVRLVSFMLCIRFYDASL
jgi:hypothetical protein